MADIDKLAVLQSYDPFLAKALYGEDWQAKVEAHRRQGDVPLQNQREPPPHLLIDRPDGDGPGQVRCPVEVLRAAVDQVERAWLQPAVGLRPNAVMDNRGIGTGCRDRLEA